MIRNLFLLIFGIGILFKVAVAAELADPYKNVKLFKLNNGAKVVFASDKKAKNVQIKVKFSAGFFVETPGKEGVAHLLEHYLFTDSKLERDMTYLQVIQEKGGSANAFTDSFQTVYYATLPYELSQWGVLTFSKMLFERTFDQKVVDLSKGPVFLEIGQPSFFDHIFEAVLPVFHRFLSIPLIWELHFGIKYPHRKLVADKINTASLSAQDLKDFYEKFYHSKNMTIFIAGNFDEKTIKELLNKEFGKALNGSIENGWIDPKPRAVLKPYYRTSAAIGVPQIEIGTKVADLTFEDDVIARIYIEYLSHRLMKEIRNNRGETYSIKSEVETKYGNGYVSIKLEAPKERYYHNLNLMRGLIDEEARKGKITKEAFQEAIGLYKKGFARIEHDSSAMMGLANRADWVRRNYPNKPEHQTDFNIANDLSLERYVSRLNVIFNPKMSFSLLDEPPLLFRFDSILFLILGFVVWMKVLRRVFAKKFEHNKIRWIRKIDFPWVYSLQISLVFIVFFALIAFNIFLYRFWHDVEFFQRSILLSDYISAFIATGFSLIITQVMFGSVARKVMVVRNELWVKTLGYNSFVFRIEDIDSVDLHFPFQVAFSFKTMRKVKYRFWYYSSQFWRRGILINFKDGRACFFGTNEPKDVCKELKAIVVSVESAHNNT